MKRFDSMFSCNTRTATDATCAAPAASCASENFIITMDTAILAVSIAVKLYMMAYNRRIGKKLNAPALLAAAADSLSDSVATAAVLLATLLGQVFGWRIDGWAGLAVAGFILYAGVGAARDTISPLLGNPPTPEFVEEIRSLVMAHPEVLGIHDLVVHDYGPGRRMISLHGEVSGDCDIFEIHDVIDRIEKELKEKLGCEAVIHMDPIVVNNEAINETKKEVVDMINEHFPGVTIHDFRMVQGPTHTNLIFDAVVPFQYGKTNEEVKQGIAKLISEKWDGYYAVIQAEQSYLE